MSFDLPSFGAGGGNSPPTSEKKFEAVELGDAPDLTRTMQRSGSFDHHTVVASWSSLERFAAQFKGDNGNKWWSRSNVRNRWSEDFNGAESFDAALDMAIHGWAEGGALIEKTRGYIQALNPLSPRMIKYGIAGSTPNVPRAIAGNILNMRVPDNAVSKKKKTITIVYNMCENGGVDKDMISNKAAVAAALIDEIESKGFSCEVIAAVVSYCYKGGYSPEHMSYGYEFVRVKESHIPVDINRLAFGLGHASMFRGLFFGDMQRNSEFQHFGSGLGCATTTFPTKELCEEQIYTITSTNAGLKSAWYKDLDTAATKGLNEMVRELQRQGCPAFPKLKDHEDDLDEEPREEDEDEPYDHSTYEW